VLSKKYQIAHILANHGQMGRRHHHFQPIDLLELEGFSIGGTGHARQFLIQAEIVLKRDRGQRLILGLNWHSFLGFDGLMETVRPAPARHGSTGKLIDDDHLVTAHDVFHILVKQGMCSQASVQMMKNPKIGSIVQAFVAV